MIFLWSRIRSTTDHSVQAYSRLRHLTFHDFLEALVRLSMLIALPTNDDLQETGAVDAGQFLISLYAASPTQYARFVEERGGRWDREPRQKIWKCFDHSAPSRKPLSRTGRVCQ